MFCRLGHASSGLEVQTLFKKYCLAHFWLREECVIRRCRTLALIER